MHIRSFLIDLDAPAGIAAELVQIVEAATARAIETSDEIKEMEEECERRLDDEHDEHEVQREALGESILELEGKVKSMSVVSVEEKAKHRAALSGIMEDLAEMDIG